MSLNCPRTRSSRPPRSPQRSSRLPVLEIQKPVLQRQVEQSALPDLQPVRRPRGVGRRRRNVLLESGRGLQPEVGPWATRAAAPAGRAAEVEGRIWCSRARFTSTASSNLPSRPSRDLGLALGDRLLELARRIARHERRLDEDQFVELDRLRSIWGSSTTTERSRSSVSQTPTRAWPSVNTSTGLRPACSRQKHKSGRGRGRCRPCAPGSPTAPARAALTSRNWRAEDVGDRVADHSVPDRLPPSPTRGPSCRPCSHRSVSLAGLPQLLGGIAQDDVNARVGRADEGRQQLRRGRRAAPETRRQQVHLLGQLGEDLVPAAHTHRDLGASARRQP